MNKVYRVVFNHVTGAWGAVAETAKGRTKSKTSNLVKTLVAVLAVAAVAGVAVPRRAEAYVAGTGAVQGNAANTVIGDGASGPTGNCISSSGVPIACSTVIGNGANTTFQSSTIVGDHASTTGSYSVAIGSWATAGIYSQAIGANAQASGDHATAIGQSALATTTDASAVGTNAQATGKRTVALGSGAKAVADDAFALGWGTNASGTGSMAVGTRVTTSGINAIGMGLGSNAGADYATAIGSSATASGVNSIAMGRSTISAGDAAVAIGNSSNVDVTAGGAVALGSGAKVLANMGSGVALGNNSVVDRENTVSVGSSAQQRQVTYVAAGTQNTDAVNVSQLNSLSTSTSTGLSTTNNNVNSLSTSTSSGLSTTRSSVTSLSTSASTGLSTANSNVNSLSTSASTGVASLSTGLSSTNSNVNSLSTSASTGLSTVSSDLTNATRYFKADGKNDGSDDASVVAGSNSVAIGAGSVATRNNVVEVGNRQITGVTAGTEDTDAVNVKQLKDAGLVDAGGNALDAVVYDAGSGKGAVTFAGTNGTVLKNVAGGVEATDAVNVGQLNTAKTDLGNQIGDVTNNLTNATRYFKATGKNDGSDDAVAAGNNAVAVGANAQARFDNTVAIGNGAAATWTNAVAVGSGATASQESVALGHDAKARNNNDTAIGAGATANLQSTAVGAGASAISAGTALGQGARVLAANGVALGVGATVMPMANNSVALGAGTVAMRSNTVDVGNRQITSVADGTADSDAVNLSQLKGLQGQIGDLDALAVTYTDAGKTDINLGNGAGGTTVIHNVGEGVAATDAVNKGQLDTQIGNVTNNLTNATRYFKADGKGDGSDDASVAAGSNSVAIGAGSVAARSNVVEVGGRQISGLAAGTEDTDAVNLKQLKDAGLVDAGGTALDAVVYDAGSGKASVTFAGSNGTVLNNVADGNIAAGSRQAVNGGQIAALRDSLQNQITNVDNRVTNIENNGGGVASDPHFVSAGNKEQAAVATPGSSSVGVGENAQATANNAVAIGANSVANQANTVSVGSAGNERAIVNVAEGVASTDAVNVGQMNNMVNNSAAQTLQSANEYTDQRFGQVNNAINEVDKAASRGIAAAAALNNVTPYIPGKTSLNAGIASYRGSTALGVTVSRWNQRGNVNLNAGFSSAGNNSTIVRAGVGVVFGN